MYYYYYSGKGPRKGPFPGKRKSPMRGFSFYAIHQKMVITIRQRNISVASIPLQRFFFAKVCLNQPAKFIVRWRHLTAWPDSSRSITSVTVIHLHKSYSLYTIKNMSATNAMRTIHTDRKATIEVMANPLLTGWVFLLGQRKDTQYNTHKVGHCGI